MYFKVALVLFLFSTTTYGNVCPTGSHWVRQHHRRAYTRGDGTFVSATTVSAHCQKNPPGYAFWEPKFNNGRPLKWPHNGEVTKVWIEEEKERVLEALSILPEILWADTIQGIYRMKDSKTTLNNSATSAPGMIILYDSAFDKSKKLPQILSHELAHEHYRHLSPETAKTYQEENGWTNLKQMGGPDKWITSRTKFVEPDGRDLPDEDYANNIEYFLFNPTKLELFDPIAYDWIKRHFGDKLKFRKN